MGVLALIAAISGCGGTSIDNSAACKDAVSTASRYENAAQQLFDGDATLPTAPASCSDSVGCSPDLNAQRRTQAQQAMMADYRLAARVILQNPGCFDAQDKAKAQEYLDQTNGN